MALKEIAKHYDPKTVEDKWTDVWTAKNYFHAKVNKGKKPFTIVIPPPNVTAALHMGHALNNMLQDIIIRYKRQSGFETLWLPGTDHAGIATQNVVERELKKEGKTRHDLGREKFVERVWQWKYEQRDRILSQLKKIGASCDWERERFTLDEGLSNAVKEVFIRLYKKGSIYRGTYIINWCPRCTTALSDEEVDHDDVDGHFWHFNYPIKGERAYVEIATTRPETMLGDTAVAVHPEDERFQHLIGKTVVLPLMNREIPIIADRYVDMEFGTGIIKVTPGHDPNDYELGKRHNLPEINILNNDGTLNENAGSYEGMDRFTARKKIIDDMNAEGLLLQTENHVHSVGHCQRCATVVEPIISTQWFVKMKKLSEPAIAAIKNGDIKLHPNNRGYKNYMNWMDNVRDWCISRQLWWGHRIPVYYCENCGHENVEPDLPESCSKCGHHKLRQDEDVLDTWFSSWLWPFSTMGWPENTPELEYFYPTDVLVTAQDILFFWVARMIIAGYEFMGNKPFSDVVLTGIVRDEIGRKMSKSLGNGIDPLDMVDQYGADAVRYTLTRLTSDGQDINLSEHMLEVGRNFANKIWNAFRFLSLNIDKLPDFPEVYQNNFNLADRWILSRLQQTINAITKKMEIFRQSEAMEEFYQFFWGEYCAWYLELIKERLYRSENAEERETALSIASYVMKTSMELLHPFMPFISEEIWQFFKPGKEESVTQSNWPVANKNWSWTEDIRKMEIIQNVITSIRTIRAEMNVAPSRKAELFLKGIDSDIDILEENKNIIFNLAGIERVRRIAEKETPDKCVSAVVDGIELFVPLADLIDLDIERARLEKEINRLEGLIKSVEKKLSNENFISRAPENVVLNEKDKLENFQESLTKVMNSYSQIKN